MKCVYNYILIGLLFTQNIFALNLQTRIDVANPSYIKLLKENDCYDPNTNLQISSNCHILTAQENKCLGSLIRINQNLTICKKLKIKEKKYPPFNYEDPVYIEKLKSNNCYDQKKFKKLDKHCKLLYGDKNICPTGSSVVYKGINNGETYAICSEYTQENQNKSHPAPGPGLIETIE